jgi:uncharacterized protein
MIPEPLSESELDRLAEVLAGFRDNQAMNLEEMDGFLAAVTCGPEEIPLSEWQQQVLGDDLINDDAFAAQPVFQDFLSLVARHRQVIDHTLRSGEVFTPLLLADEDGVYRANDWANGFMRGMGLRWQDWAPLLDDEDNGGLLVPIFALAHEHDPDPKMRPYPKPMDAEMRERLIVGAAAGVMRIYDYFAAERVLAKRVLDDPTYRRMAPKVGRNEPCPCGSGKKFKLCCGKVTLP